MSVNEQALLRLMKQQHKAAGYGVAMTEGGGWINITGDDWSVWHRMKTLPRKVLALIVEHMGQMLIPGSCCRVSKKCVQDEIWDVIVDDEPGSVRRYPEGKIAATDLRWQERRIWQQTDGNVWLLDPELEELLGAEGALYYSGGRVCLDDGISRVYIEKESLTSADQEMARRIGAYMWVPGKE